MMGKSSKSVAMSVNQVSQNTELLQFIDYVNREQGPRKRFFENDRSCFLEAPDLREAYLYASLCFVGLSNFELLEQEIRNPSALAYLKKELTTANFSWELRPSIYEMFEKNAKRLGNQYPMLWKEVFSKVSEEEAARLFSRVKESHLLNGVRVRMWNAKTQRTEHQFKRINESNELQKISQIRFLLICPMLNDSKVCGYCVGLMTDFESEESMQESPSVRQSLPPEQFQKIIVQQSETNPVSQNQSTKHTCKWEDTKKNTIQSYGKSQNVILDDLQYPPSIKNTDQKYSKSFHQSTIQEDKFPIGSLVPENERGNKNSFSSAKQRSKSGNFEQYNLQPDNQKPLLGQHIDTQPIKDMTLQKSELKKETPKQKNEYTCPWPCSLI